MKRPTNPNSKGEKIDGSVSIDQKKVRMKKKKNMMRMGGGGLSLEAFAKAKTKSNDYNPALIRVLICTLGICQGPCYLSHAGDWDLSIQTKTLLLRSGYLSTSH
ncbi:hypothetical protein RHMOL_Rhmol13G0021500 [Rhododendron molle]|uniref:Uncharacterized protein n=1 Tax=Rhododendron molle TaxID=49168 RepID=A0ACC0L215_RHOML|nr:hypothetical protein RHMOL_Rhmol13G0021500 [Rhododendron molle]